MRVAVVLVLAGVVSIASLPALTFAQDPRVRQLEIEVARLQRELAAQQRRIDQLERELRVGAATRPAAGGSRAADTSPAWLTLANWERVRVGMQEVEVIAILGRPTSVRGNEASGPQTFFYAMELGPTSLLAGNVRFGAGGVTEVRKPEVR